MPPCALSIPPVRDGYGREWTPMRVGRLPGSPQRCYNTPRIVTEIVIEYPLELPKGAINGDPKGWRRRMRVDGRRHRPGRRPVRLRDGRARGLARPAR